MSDLIKHGTYVTASQVYHEVVIDPRATVEDVADVMRALGWERAAVKLELVCMTFGEGLRLRHPDTERTRTSRVIPGFMLKGPPLKSDNLSHRTLDRERTICGLEIPSDRRSEWPAIQPLTQWCPDCWDNAT